MLVLVERLCLDGLVPGGDELWGVTESQVQSSYRFTE